MVQENSKILIVDDEEELCEILSSLLTSQGYECEIAHTGQSGFEKAKEWNPDIVLSDIRMPEGNGIELLENINEHNPELSVILISGYADYTESELKDRGASLVFQKPVDFQILKSAIQELLQKKSKAAS